MALTLNKNENTERNESKSMALLNKYLKEAVWLTSSDTIIGANRYLADFATRPRWEEIKREDIEARQKENKEKMKRFGFRDKAAYYANIKSKHHEKETLIKMGVIAATIIAATAVSPDLGRTVAGISAAYLGSKLAAGTIGEPTTPKELFSTRDYVDLKHEQLALRKLERHLTKKEKMSEAKSPILSLLCRDGR